MATPEKRKTVARELLVVRLYELQRLRELFNEVHRQGLKRSFRILEDFEISNQRPTNKDIAIYLQDELDKQLLYFDTIKGEDGWDKYHSKIKYNYLKIAFKVLDRWNLL
jgi:hypothetical protein